ncbi:MAG: hypothetical protein AAGK71_13455 [Pseudomonadota bacterium]
MSKPRRILRNQFIIPFGRFRINRPREWDNTPVLVGREGQRAFFVDALTGIGERGAFLITGRRGVGKTTFVESCLQDYRQNDFRRFLGSGVGRSIYDFLLLILFTLAIIGVLLAAGELLTFLVPALESSPLLFAPTIGCLVVATVPFLLGFRALRSALSIVPRVAPSALSIAFSGAIAFLLLVLPPFGSPTHSIAVFILGLGVLFTLGSLFMFKAPLPLGPFKGVEEGFVRTERKSMVYVATSNLILPLAATILLTACFHWVLEVHAFYIPGDGKASNEQLGKFYFGLLAIGAALVQGTVLGQALAVRRITALKKNRVDADSEIGSRLWLRTLILTIVSAISLFILGGLLEVLTLSTFVSTAGSGGVAMAVVAFRRSYYYLGRDRFFKKRFEKFESGSVTEEPIFEPRFFAPPVEAVLVAKAIALMLVSLQLLYPALVPLSGQEDRATPEAWALCEDARKQAETNDAASNASNGGAATAADSDPNAPNSGDVVLNCNERPLRNYDAMFDLTWADISAGFQMLISGAEETSDTQSDASTQNSTGDPKEPTDAAAKDQVDDAGPKTCNEDASGGRQSADCKNRDAGEKKVVPAAFTLFDLASDEIRGWFIGVFFLFAFLFLIEYEWINRPFVNQRQPRAMARGPRRPQQAHHHLDPIWFEVSAARQFERQKERYPELRSKTLLDYYEPPVKDGEIAPKQQRDSLFSRRNALQRMALRRFRMMESATFASVITGIWLPVLQVNVNLGFVSLDHRGVTHAMLDGLRRAYRHTFVKFGTPYQIIRAFGMGFSVMILVVLLGSAWFDFPRKSEIVEIGQLNEKNEVFKGETPETTDSTPSADNVCDYLDTINLSPNGTGRTVLFPNLICDVAPGVAEPVIDFLYAEIVPFELPAPYRTTPGEPVTSLPVFWFFHFNVGPPDFVGAEGEKSNETSQEDPSLSFRIYHLLLLAVIYGILDRISRRYPILPYRKNLKRIEGLLDELMLRRSDTRSARTGLQISRLWSPLGDHETRMDVETSRDALDPRSVELKLLALLTDLRGNPVAGLRKQRQLTIPRPDIHFIFDELDKLSGSVGAEYTSYQVDKQDRETIDSERQRAFRLHRLLSDMKRVISAAPARFIFVGGRSLHDEWIRDQNRLGSTQPLLTSVFDHEIYLQSLLVDLPRARHSNALLPHYAQPERALDLRVLEFLSNNFISARELEQELRANRYLPWLGLGRMSTTARFFANHIAPLREKFGMFELIDARLGSFATERKYALRELNGIWKREFFVTLIGFLAYRSAGSPKKLNELVGTLIRPSGSFLSPDIEGDAVVPTSRDSLVIDDKETYRAQFINSLFRHIEASFGADLLQRDDKITINTIFIFDFLMKMHNRAFSWSSIERLDELAHIHRAPDLRRLFDSVVTNSAERYFHRVLNGLFAFRFRSDLAIEIRYLSRISQAEMAALNFTLDESHELKTTFTSMLETAGEENADLLTALGELYEFDQSYDIARSYYERALRSVDAEFMRSIGSRLDADDPVQDEAESVLASRDNVTRNVERLAVLGSHRPGPDPEPFLMALLSGSKAARKAVRLNFPWAIRRIRLMLQIGLTFEQQADEERAQTQYHAAQVFAEVVMDVALKDEENGAVGLSVILKHLSLIFQPTFASAWTAEKLESGLDAGFMIAEDQLKKLRQRLAKPEDLNLFALSFAELYNKSGDLYFFKGRAAYRVPDNFFGQFKSPPNEKKTGQEGYLFRAHLNYALALHQVRRFNVTRLEASKNELHIVTDGDTPKEVDKNRWSTLDSKNLPTFVMQIAYSSLVDLAEAVLARTSLMEAWIELDATETKLDEIGKCFGKPWSLNPTDGKSYVSEIYNETRKQLDEWFLWSDSKVNDDKLRGVAEVLQDYLGKWAGHSGDKGKDDGDSENGDDVLFETFGNSHERILVALVLSLNGARAVNRANYPDAASFESQITAEHVIRLLRMARAVLMARQKSKDSADQHTVKDRLRDSAENLKIGESQLKFLSILIQIGVFASQRIVELKKLAYPENQANDHLTREDADTEQASRYRTTDTAEIVAAALASEMRLLISGLSVFVKAVGTDDGLDKDTVSSYLAAWNAEMDKLSAQVGSMLDERLAMHVGAYQKNYSKLPYEPAEVRHRRMSRAMLIYLVTHHKYPALTNLTALKALIDDAVAVDGCDMSLDWRAHIGDQPKKATAKAEKQTAAAQSETDRLRLKAKRQLNICSMHIENTNKKLVMLQNLLRNIRREEKDNIRVSQKKTVTRLGWSSENLKSWKTLFSNHKYKNFLEDLEKSRRSSDRFHNEFEVIEARLWDAEREFEVSSRKHSSMQSARSDIQSKSQVALGKKISAMRKVTEKRDVLENLKKSASKEELSQASHDLAHCLLHEITATLNLVDIRFEHLSNIKTLYEADLNASLQRELIVAYEKKLAETAEGVAKDQAENRLSEAKIWLGELLEAEKLLDAPVHFPPSYMAETLSLMAIDEPGSEELENLSRKFRWRAEQAYTMGRQYYQNLSRLVYLFDDFNDRRRHSIHAGQMAMADFLAFFRYVLDKR